MSSLTEPASLGRSAVDFVVSVMRDVGSVSARATLDRLDPLEGGFSRRMYSGDVVDSDGENFGIIVCVRGSDSLLDSSLDQEYGIFEQLTGLTFATPRLHGKCVDPGNPLGGVFFVMDRLAGEAPNVWRSRDRKHLEENWRSTQRIAKDMVSTLATIHTADVAPFGGFVRQLGFHEVVARWKKSYEEVRLVRDPVVDEAYDWVMEKEPSPAGIRLVHGDYRIGNCLVDGGTVTGVLDWELAYLGDPRFDLGYLALAYSAGKLFTAGSELMGGFADRQWFWDQYSALTGTPVEPDVILTFSVVSVLMLVANLSAGVHTFVKRGVGDLRMLWSRLPIMSLRQDLVHMMDWPRSEVPTVERARQC